METGREPYMRQGFDNAKYIELQAAHIKERISQLYAVDGSIRVPVDEVCAGDIAATVKLKDTRTPLHICRQGLPSFILMSNKPHC